MLKKSIVQDDKPLHGNSPKPPPLCSDEDSQTPKKVQNIFQNPFYQMNSDIVDQQTTQGNLVNGIGKESNDRPSTPEGNIFEAMAVDTVFDQRSSTSNVVSVSEPFQDIEQQRSSRYKHYFVDFFVCLT